MAGQHAPPPSDAGFEVVRKGYDQGQVDAHMRRLDAEVSILVTDRDAALAQSAQLARELDEARVHAERLRAQVRSLASPQQSPQNTSERIRSMLRLAEDEVADMLGRAETEANRRTKEADAQAEQTLAAARADAESLREEARTDAEKMRQETAEEREEFVREREEALERLAAERTATEADLRARAEAAEAERARAWAESEERRALVEEDFSIAMDQRRAEALAALGAERAAATREAEELRESARSDARATIARAEATAREMIADAERRVAELVTARARIAEQLGVTRSMLDDTLGSLALPPEQLLAPAPPAHDPAPSRNGSSADAAQEDVSTDEPGAERDRTTGRPEDNGSGPEHEGTPPSDDEPEDAAQSGQPQAPRPHRRQRRRSKAGSTRR
ncbi:ATP synthase F0 subunit B [Pseudonocardia kunmingensis]|uniref:DivIVA protein n=1 Tax=Pseudonocardia kunmingensis TaxID=630975 RepID=A0A543E043_9PSEU|nr:ATP synthase F0 subunit B [Pseudonocardia kunmingensis]TQM14955.1 hypothetical protein FB558_1734 [Pseudonocardia kunmingensis]